MNRGFTFYRTMLITLVVLAFTIEIPQGSNASTDDYNEDYSGDSPFSLPFDSDMADQSNNDGENYQSDNDIPFP